jgi:hypothetical protein
MPLTAGAGRLKPQSSVVERWTRLRWRFGKHRISTGAMLRFLSSLGAEFAARRRRLRKAIGDGRASLLEFVLLAGVLIGVAAPSFGPNAFLGRTFAPLLPVLAVLGYIVLDAGRQRALATGAEEAGVSAAFDARALWFLAVVAAAGYATFAWAVLAPEPFELAPAEPPPGALDVTIGP